VTVPVPKPALALGDDALVLSHRLGEWAGHAPVLEEEVALANIALDLLGQARILLSLAGDEDELAYLREERAFRNCQLVEQPNGDFAHTITRQLYFSTYQHLLYERLAAPATTGGAFGPFTALAAKAVKEVAYHQDHARQWTLRLGDGTDESHHRMQRACESLWRFTGELFQPLEGLDGGPPADGAGRADLARAVGAKGAGDTGGPEGTGVHGDSGAHQASGGTRDTVRPPGDVRGAACASGGGVDWAALESDWLASVTDVLKEATLTVPESSRSGAWSAGAGRQGLHTEPFGRMLAEMQHLHRSHPGASW
jgi:ring-1,2-phenylacetyl-CoA epoxidase subunit PaaC